MLIHLILPIILLVLIAVVVLANMTIIAVIASGGRFSHAAASAIKPDTVHFCGGECPAYVNARIAEARCECDCRCHSERASMHPGMYCLDCFGELCDEGTVQ